MVFVGIFRNNNSSIKFLPLNVVERASPFKGGRLRVSRIKDIGFKVYRVFDTDRRFLEGVYLPEIVADNGNKADAGSEENVGLVALD